MAIYVPRVLLCGDAAEFRKIIGDKPVEVVGQVNFVWTGDDAAKLFFDGYELTGEGLNRLLDGAAEYLLFNDPLEHKAYLETYPMNTQILTADVFAKKIHDGFFSLESLYSGAALLGQENFSGRVLDYDCFFAKGDCRARINFNFALDGFAENFGGKLFPILENLYGKIYRTFDECRYHIFDAIVLAKERTPEEFMNVLAATDALSGKIFAFIRRYSVLENWIHASKDMFAQVSLGKERNGAWYLIEKKMPPADLSVYVVTHKDAQLSALPEGYRFIHAGHALAAQDFGYLGDDTGDNISRLNHYLDETTALYWIWKNTKHTHVGLIHYRRFFTAEAQETFDATKILSKAEILRLLGKYDIIVQEEYLRERNQLELMLISTGQPDLIRIAEMVIRKHLAKAQPDYLDAYDAVINGLSLFICGIHITRRNIFDAYCQWLFSFLLDATIELRDKIRVGDIKLEEMPHVYSRIAGHFAERMLTVWLTKNHLRIKTLPVMYRENV